MIAIILVNYNGYEDTKECIWSLQKQTYRDFKIIVVDNFSTDNSYNKLNKLKEEFEFILLKAKENNGFAAGNNIGIEYAKKMNADYIWLLNNDTLVNSDTLTNLVKGFQLSSRCGITIGKIYYESKRDIIWYAGGNVNKHTSRTEHWRYNEKDTGNIEFPKVINFTTGCCMLISMELINTIGDLDETFFLYEEDLEYSLRTTRAGYQMLYIPDSIIYHKVSSSTSKKSGLIQYYAVRNKFSIIKTQFHSINKLTAYVYSTFQILYRCIKGELNIKICVKAIKAFYRKEIGKSKYVQ